MTVAFNPEYLTAGDRAVNTEEATCVLHVERAEAGGHPMPTGGTSTSTF